MLGAESQYALITRDCKFQETRCSCQQEAERRSDAVARADSVAGEINSSTGKGVQRADGSVGEADGSAD